jgi:hypothetical protein
MQVVQFLAIKVKLRSVPRLIASESIGAADFSMRVLAPADSASISTAL